MWPSRMLVLKEEETVTHSGSSVCFICRNTHVWNSGVIRTEGDLLDTLRRYRLSHGRAPRTDGSILGTSYVKGMKNSLEYEGLASFWIFSHCSIEMKKSKYHLFSKIVETGSLEDIMVAKGHRFYTSKLEMAWLFSANSLQFIIGTNLN